VLGPKLLHGEAIASIDALLLFPILVVGVALNGLLLTGIVDGRQGLQDLFTRVCRWRMAAPWYARRFSFRPA
jgi:hypothetical protein